MDERETAAIKQSSHLAVFRHEDQVWRMNLEEEEFVLLKKIFGGAKVGEALSEIEESQAQKISSWFSRWINNGLLAFNNQ